MKPKLKTIKRNNKLTMHKAKVKSAAKKRFSLTATGKVNVTQANKQHNMRKRSKRQLRNQRGTVITKDTNNILKYCNLHLN